MAVMTLKATQQDMVKAQLADILMHVSWGDTLANLAHGCIIS